MNQLDEGISKERFSDRVGVAVPVLDKHQDHRSEQRKSRRLGDFTSNMPKYAMTDSGRPNEGVLSSGVSVEISVARDNFD